ncbi:pentapeptide repeat-containing protein [Cellulomonas xiejunii]|uniref:Pentapeptide repeat-containing protein n=1 Tax=Cellulomonas xiejunii TaxID=2968083 RepID=A0ABY5KMR5_9CELL|nr:pentapeptide repeat-containing protein [Cellulomonas xiejunii]MCC2320816.1 pentapeptide repeat-containing protein [Cellulomonas xiejunii]UUI71100.1 pentapeptide repeat-containing protein [Cellulomonas xiejunii]
MLTGDAYDLEPDADLDAVRFHGLDLTGRDASRARFLECEMDDCDVDGVVLDGARVLDTSWTAVRAGALRAPASTWRDVTLTDLRVGAFTAFASTWTRVTVTGGKIDYLDLRESTVQELRLVDVTLGDLDLSHARVKRLVVVDCDVRRLDTTEARLAECDLRGARLHVLEGVGGLGGAKVTRDQLLDLAPLLAHHVGLVVDD